MDTYRYLQVDNYQSISDKIYEYVINYTNILSTEHDWNTLNNNEVLEHVPELFEACSTLTDFPIKLLSIIYRKRGDDGKIHIDNNDTIYRLLWPIRNCQGSFTKFYDLNGNSTKTGFNPNGNSYTTIIQENPLIEIASVELTQPLVFNVKVPHGVFTNHQFAGPRLSLTIGFGKHWDPSKLLNNL